jgi:hypothetical protein
MRFVLIIAAFLCAAELCAYASIQQDVIERDTIGGGGGGGGGGDLSSTDIDTFAELDAIVADEGLVNLNDAQTLLNKIIDGNSNTIRMLRDATDCTSYTGAVDGQYCWEQDDNVLYVCETADECDTPGEWDAIASGSPLTVEESDANPTVSNVSKVQFNAAHFTVTDEGGGQVQVDSILSPLASALASNPTDCSANQYATTIAANGNLTCTQVAGSQVTNTPAGNIAASTVQAAIDELDSEKLGTSGNAATASALAANPTDCSANQFANAITANGNLTCAALTDSDIPNTITIDAAAALASNPSDCSANQYATTIAANGSLTCAQVSGSQVSNTPAGNVSATTAQAAIDELDTEKPDKSRIKTLFVFRPTMNEPPVSNFATIDTRNSHPVLDFDGSTNESAVFTFVMPQAYSGGGVTVYIHYAMTSATSGDIDWDVSFERVGDQQQDIDSDSFASVQSVDNTVVPGTSGLVDVVSVSFTNGAQMDSCAAGEVCRIKITRDAASDTDNTDAELVAAELRES